MGLQRDRSDRKFWMTALILCAVCFAVHIFGVQKLYSPFLYPEEMGYWSGAALLTGHDWSQVIRESAAPWYTYGYSLILAPLFLLFDDMPSMYRAAIALNALWATLSLLLCFSIAKRFGRGIDRYRLLFASFVVALYSSYIHQAKIAVVETFLYFLIWVLFLSFVRYEEKPSYGRGVWLGCIVSVVYIAHNRAVGILIAFGITVVVMLARRKIGWKDLVFLLAPVLVFFVINQQMAGYFSGALWGEDDMSGADYSRRINYVARLFTGTIYLVGLVKSVIGKLWYAFTASFMLCLWGLVYAVQKLWRYFKDRDSDGLPFSICFFLLAYMGVTAISALTMNNTLPDIPGLSKRIDGIVYGRYAECAVGVFLLFGILKLFDLKDEPKRQTALMAGGAFLAYAVFSVVVVRYADQLVALNHGKVNWPTVQVNSTPGLFFYRLMGGFSFINCSLFAAAVSALIFLAFTVNRRKDELRAFAGILVIACFVFTGYYSSKVYTFTAQAANGSENFRELVDAVEWSLRGKNVFVDSEDHYVYYDFQNNMIHNAIYAGGGAQ